MEIVLVHWLIKKGAEERFKVFWQRMSVETGKGLYREVLTQIDDGVTDPKFHTFSLANPNYVTFINVGIWESVAHFDAAIGKYIPEAKHEEKDGKITFTITLEEFEFKLRERLVLKSVLDRGGNLPPAALAE